MIYAAPGATTEIVADNFATGLAGTIGYRVRTSAGADSIARTTVGIVEDIAGSGIYRANITAPATAGQYTIVWDDGAGSPKYATEELVVTYTAPGVVAGPSYGGYWAASDLAELAPRPGNMALLASALPLGATTFQTMIGLVSAGFDAAAAKVGKVVPIPTTATQAYLIAQNVVREGALAMAFERVYTGPDPKFIDRFKLAYDTAIAAIGNGTMVLPGAADDTSQSSRLLVRSNGVASRVFTASMGYTDAGGAADF